MALTPSSDIYASNVVLLLPFDENLTDYSAVPKTVTTVGSAAVSTVQKKYGVNSCYFDGSGCYLSLIDSTDWVFGTAVTIEFWVYLTGNGNSAGYNSVLGQRASTNNNSWYVHLMTNNVGGYGPAIEVRNASGTVVVSCISSNSSYSTPQNTWVHVAVTYDGATIRTFQNGTLTASAAFTSSWSDSVDKLTIGYLPNSAEKLLGYIDELRITKGIARYTTNFTPPQSFFTIEASFNTVTGLPSLQDLFAAAFTVTTAIPSVTNMALFLPCISAKFVVIAEIPVSQSTAAFAIPVFCAFVDNTPCIISQVQTFHPYNENSELSHTTLPYAPLVKTERNIRFIGRQV